MASYATPKVEFSPDPLSDTTPSWIDVTQYCQGMSWFGGKTKDLDGPEAGGATFVLKNIGRRFEPEYTAGAYYPNIVPGRRFRITINAQQQGVYYAREWKVEYPDPSLGYSTVTVSCSDGYWRLSNDLLANLNPPSAATYEDVVMHDNPWGYWKLDEETGGAMNATAGPSGAYRGNLLHVKPNPVLGDSGFAIYSGASATYGRAKLDDDSVWVDSGQVSCEGVVYRPSGTGTGTVVLGPFRTPTTADYIFGLNTGGASVWPSAATSVFTSGSHVLSAGHHHVAMTWDGSTLSYYQDGVVVEAVSGPGNAPVAPDTNEFIRIAGDVATASLNGWTLSHAAVYNYALTPAQIADHAAAATSRGYDAQTAGTRIAALATDPLWSTAGITAGSVTVSAVMQHGQPVIDEIQGAASAELPGSVFYFNDNGDPAYHTLLEMWTPSATFGDTGSEVRYDQIDLAYDDDLFNTATVSGEGLAGATATNSQSLADYGNRGVPGLDSLPIVYQTDAALLAQTYVDRFSTPAYRVESIALNGADPQARAQILTREIGDVIRVKRRGTGGTPTDVITRILRKEKSLDVNGDLRCVWSLARGFNASVSGWHIGVTGFSEVGQTTVAG